LQKNLYIKNTNNIILILINNLIKYTTYIATIKEFNIKNLQSFYKKSLYIIFDKDLFFIKYL